MSRNEKNRKRRWENLDPFVILPFFSVLIVEKRSPRMPLMTVTSGDHICHRFYFLLKFYRQWYDIDMNDKYIPLFFEILYLWYPISIFEDTDGASCQTSSSCDLPIMIHWFGQLKVDRKGLLLLSHYLIFDGGTFFDELTTLVSSGDTFKSVHGRGCNRFVPNSSLTVSVQTSSFLHLFFLFSNSSISPFCTSPAIYICEIWNQREFLHSQQ